MATPMNIDQVIGGHYQFKDWLGEGGQAILGKAVDLRNGTHVVVKQLSADPQSPTYPKEVARFLRAAGLKFNHPVINSPIDLVIEDGQYYMILPFVDGDDLAILLGSRRIRLSVDQASWTADQVADGLHAIHTAGIIHRDIKPANIIRRHDGTIAICDFGICHLIYAPTITTGQAFIGTFDCSSPEQLKDATSVDARSDLYSLGVVFYYMLTGQYPTRGTTQAEIEESIRSYTPPSPKHFNPAIPANIDHACMRLLAKSPDQRFPEAQAFRHAIGVGQPTPANGVCFSCHLQLRPDSQFCGYCGVSLMTKAPSLPRCLACGAVVGEAGICPSCLKQFSHANHRIQVESGSLTGEVFRIPEGAYEVGRMQLGSRDQHISRRQLFVNCVNGTVYVQDAGGANKTLVAGQPADRPVLLVAGSELWIAGNTAIYSSN